MKDIIMYKSMIIDIDNITTSKNIEMQNNITEMKIKINFILFSTHINDVNLSEK